MTSPVRLIAAAVTCTLAGALLSGCASTTASDAGGEPDARGTFPISIEHAFGSTTIEQEPERIVTWGWATADAAIALGVVPVAMPYQPYGSDGTGVLPWVREALEEDGADEPVLLPDTGEDVPFEDIAAEEPDLILAHYSGLTEEQYDTLSAIAPVVAYPEEPWSTPWRDIISIAGDALGRADEADAVLADIDGSIAAAAAEHPEFDGVTLATAWDRQGTFYVYSDEDPRVEFMLDLGFENAEAVDDLDTDESAFYFTLSPERVSELESDVLVVYGETPDEAANVIEAPYAQSLTSIQTGAVAQLIGTEFVASVSPPSALSLAWGLDDTVAQLAGAVAALND